MSSFLISLPDVPVAVLSFGLGLDPKGIEEGNDVYFECNVRANPASYNITWRHNVSVIVIL